MTTTKTIALAVLALSLASVAQAGECPADKVGVDVTPPGPMMPSKVTDTVISSIDLAGYQIPGRSLRMRRLVIQPGGVVPWHSHTERPANIYVVQGAVTEYRSTCAVPITHRLGDVVAESGATSHWWRNNTSRVAILLSADILPPAMNPDSSM
jgi:quercetin dioxygenase-like cupin family protein